MEPFLAFFMVDGFFASLLGAAVLRAGPGLLTDDARAKRSGVRATVVWTIIPRDRGSVPM